MPIQVLELFDSRGLSATRSGGALTRKYVVFGTNNETEAYNALVSESPVFYDGLVRTDIKLTPDGDSFWKGEVEYSSDTLAATDAQDPGAGGDDGGDGGAGGNGGPDQPDPHEPLGGEYSFDTTGGTQHITQSNRTRSTTARIPFAAPNTMQAIGVRKDRVEGCDRGIGRFEFAKTRRLDNVNRAYLLKLRDMTYTVNERPWDGYEAGEVLFMGATGKYVGAGEGDKGKFEITFKFAVGKNQGNRDLPVGPGNPGVVIAKPTVINGDDGLIVPFVGAWDYLWVGYAENVDAAGGIPMQKPIFAVVEEIYDPAPFGDLGIGG